MCVWFLEYTVFCAGAQFIVPEPCALETASERVKGSHRMIIGDTRIMGGSKCAHPKVGCRVSTCLNRLTVSICFLESLKIEIKECRVVPLFFGENFYIYTEGVAYIRDK